VRPTRGQFVSVQLFRDGVSQLRGQKLKQALVAATSLVLLADLNPLAQLACGAEVASFGFVAQRANDRVSVSLGNDWAAQLCDLCGLPFASFLPREATGLGR
jgi:hypothetical protein